MVMITRERPYRQHPKRLCPADLRRTDSILHTPVSDWFVYAHDYALPGFRADARLHQRRHDRQEVRVDILHVTSVPILTSNS